jgi:hypothetical protein
MLATPGTPPPTSNRTRCRARAARPLPLPLPLLLLLLLLLLAACSTVPEASFPPFVDHAVAAEFVVPANGRLELPTSTALLVVHSLDLVPPAPAGAERFDGDGRRWFELTPGATVEVRCRCRAFAGVEGRPPRALDLFPAALRVVPLPAP